MNAASRDVAKNLNLEGSIYKLDAEEEKIFQRLKAEKRGDPDDSLRLAAIKERRENAIKYLSDRYTTAWTYQARLPLYFKEREKTKTKKQNNSVVNDPNKKSGNQIIKDILNHDNYLYMFFCVKHKNGGKLTSHLWFFKGFCEVLKPQYCILLDCGLEPRPPAI